MEIRIDPLPQGGGAAAPPDPANLGFGKLFASRMLSVSWSEGRGWHDARIGAYQPLVLEPSAAVFHYGQEIFEGLKAYRWEDGGIRLFRAEMNDVNFTEAVFSGDVLFSEASAGRAVFSGSQFQKNASFAGSRFREEAFFDQAVFSGTAQFSSTVFVAEVSLHAVLFCREAAFASSEFQSIARFDSARFQGGLDLSGAKIHIIRLRDAAVSGRIDLHNAEFMRLEARWPVLSHHLAYDGAAYLALVKNFRNLEWFEDADDCYYQYRRASQSAKGFFVRSGKRASINWAKLSDALAWISCGYGVRPRHTVFLSGILIVLFALIYWMGGGIVVEPLNGSGPSIGSQAALDFHDYLYFSAMVFTAKTQVKWYPVGIYRYIATIESVLGWLLLALFLVSLGRTMIR